MLDKLIINQIKSHKKYMAAAVLLGFFGLACGAALMYTSGFLISKSALQPENIMLVYVPIVLTRAFAIGQAAFLYLQRIVGHDLVLRIIAKMRVNLYRTLEPAALRFKAKYKVGDLLGLLSEDIEHLQNLYLKTIFPYLTSLLLYVIFVVVIGHFTWQFALLATLLLLFVVIVIPIISLFKLSSYFIAVKNSKNQLYQLFTDTVFGITDIMASGRQQATMKQYQHYENKMLVAESKSKIIIHIREIILSIFGGLLVIIILLWTGQAVQNGQLSKVLIAAFALMTLSIVNSLLPTSQSLEHKPSYDSSIVRINNVERYTEQFEHEVESSQISRNYIDIHDMAFSYQDTMIFKNFSLTISRGQKVALLGRSGAGKSTLVKILTGTYPVKAGVVMIDGQVCDEQSLGNKVAVLNQKPHLFDKTVLENIVLGVDDYTEAQVWEVLEQVQLKDLIASLPQQLNTPMYEMGQRFSGGERQRIAFARTLLQKTPILILDEPTIGLDPATERKLLSMFFELSQDKTVIWVTHHLNAIEQMDRIVFIADGQVEMDDTPQALYDTNNKYRRLYDMDRLI